jgi:2,4-dienoyl-CoA reductase-like NADH-dependent reductase (Old Yellow Enzyme family)
MEGKMSAQVVQRKTQRNFLDIPTAAYEAGYSPRHFRRIIEEDRIPIVQIGRKFFILGKDFSNWESSKKMKRPA